MNNLQQAIGYIFILSGIALDVFGCAGLIRLKNIYSRLQAMIKCVTLGTCLILIGTFILKGFCSTGMKAMLAVVFLLLTSPVSAHALARAAHKAGNNKI